MKLFKLYWSWYEDHEYWLFSHMMKTEEQFDADIRMIIRKVGKNFIESSNSYIGMNNWMEAVANELPSIGYEKVETIPWGIWGGYILKKNEEDTSEKIKNIIGDELFEMAIEKNKEIESRSNDYFDALRKKRLEKKS
jgi:hypothetical protein